MLFSTIPISILGIRFAMGIEPFWQPEQYSMLAALHFMFLDSSTLITSHE